MSSKPKQQYAAKDENGEGNEKDRCQTPDYGVEPLFPYLDAMQTRLGRRLVIWEPARGEGLMVATLRSRGYDVIDSDLLTGQDFLSWRPVEPYDVIVTNPPYASEIRFAFIGRCCYLAHPWALLMPTETIGCSGAQVYFIKHGLEELIPDKRIDFKMPNIGFGEDFIRPGETKKKKSTAQFHTTWFTNGLETGSLRTFVHIIKGRERERWLAQQHSDQPSLFELETV